MCRLLVAIVIPLAVITLGVTGCGREESDSSVETTVVRQTAVEVLGVRCTELESVSTTFTQALEGQTGGLDDVSYLLDAIADTVPAEIEDDYATVVRNFDEVDAALSDVDYAFGTTQSPEDLRKLDALKAKLDLEEVRTAAKRIEAWAKRNC